MADDRIRVICGPTAAGKSAIALRLALEYGATLISADSRQIYRGFDIGTAKPSPSERQSVWHRGIDVADPTERYSAARWADQASAWIAEAEAVSSPPVIVGGTGLYIRALLEPLFDAPPLDSARRARLDSFLSTLSLVELRRWCNAIDPAKSTLGRTQLARTIETALLAGARLTDLQTEYSERGGGAQQFVASYLVVDPGDLLARWIELRVDQMLDSGWANEVRSLDGNIPESAPAWKSSGYRVMRSLVRGDIGLSSARARIIIETRQYAKRQRTWFRHQLGRAAVTRVDPGAPDAAGIIERWWKESS